MKIEEIRKKQQEVNEHLYNSSGDTYIEVLGSGIEINNIHHTTLFFTDKEAIGFCKWLCELYNISWEIK